MNSNTLQSIIKSQMDDEPIKPQEVGIVISVFKGVVIAEGLNEVMYGEKVKFENNKEGMVFFLGEDHIKILLIQDSTGIGEGGIIFRTQKLFFVPVPSNLNVLLGQIWETNDLINNYHGMECEEKPIDICPPGVMERDAVVKTLHTGITAIDALIPIGRGQRELIVGDISCGKTSLAIDMIINQKNNVKKVYCIYVGIGQKASSIKRVEEILREKEAMTYTTIITANASHTAACQYITPYLAMTIAEAFKNQNEDVLIIFDDLTQHAVAYREINLIMRNIPGREAYSGDIFYIHARLLERAGNFLRKGSITAIPIVSTHDISSYIPTNIISITDGQIFLDGELFQRGQKPAINIGISVSRLGGAVQSKIMKKVCQSLKIDLAAAEELENFLQFSTDVDEGTSKIVQKGKDIKTILRQLTCSPVALWQQIVMLLGVMNNLIANIDYHSFHNIFDYIKQKHSSLINSINNDMDVNDTIANIEEIIRGISQSKKED